jgi:hypothetical protein
MHHTSGFEGPRARSAALRIAAAALLVAAIVLVTSPRASAVLVRVARGRTLSYQPLRGAAPVAPAHAGLDEFFSNLDYNGGPVMPANTNYAFYWAPPGSPAYPAEYQSGIDRYLEDLAHDSGGTQNVDSVSAQYNDAAGAFARYQSSFGGAIIDTDPYPANGCSKAPICLTDAQLQAELASYVTAHGLPADLTHMYFVLTPPGVESCFEKRGRECSAGSTRPVYCAYHGNFALGGGQLIYADDPFVTGNEGCDDGNHPNGSSDGALEGGLSHEHNEAITDPEPNNAWTDFGGSGGEEGDKCDAEMGASLGTAPDGATYNQVINGDLYWYQEEWSNQGHACLQRLAFSGAEPTATFTFKQDAGNEATFDATGSTAPGEVFRYNWQFNDGSAPVETSSPIVSHTVPAGGHYVVALTVFAADGTSIGTAQTLLIGTPPPPTVTRISPTRGSRAGGTTVTITGTGFAEVKAVDFGANAAASFQVNSETSITAVSPPGAKGTVSVSVTTPSGTSAPVRRSHFRYH